MPPSLKKARTKVEEKVAGVAEPASNILAFLAIAGVTGAAIAGAAYFYRRLRD